MGNRLWLWLYPSVVDRSHAEQLQSVGIGADPLCFPAGRAQSPCLAAKRAGDTGVPCGPFRLKGLLQLCVEAFAPLQSAYGDGPMPQRNGSGDGGCRCERQNRCDDHRLHHVRKCCFPVMSVQPLDARRTIADDSLPDFSADENRVSGLFPNRAGLDSAGSAAAYGFVPPGVRRLWNGRWASVMGWPA